MKIGAFKGIAALAGAARAAQDLLFFQDMTFAEYKQAVALNYTGMSPISLCIVLPTIC